MSHHSTTRLLSKLFITLCLLFTLSHAGTITPYGTNFIEASIANKKQLADYTFNFVPSTIIPAGGGLRVIFPSQYDSGLGVSSTPTCSVPCTVTGNTVEFKFPTEQLAGKPANATILQVMNPSSKGGTGSFQLQTIMGINVIDENLIFDVIGIADDVGTLTSTLVSVDSKGIANAGETTRYTFSFKVSQLIPANSYMKFSILDTSIGMTRFPACNAYAINGKIIQGQFHCETVGRNILVRGLNVDIPATQEVGISVAVINPPYSGITSSFTIALLREGTNVIYDVKSGIPGVTISPGIISSISLTKVDPDAIQSRKKVMDYILTFQLRNPLGANSVIAFEFPPSFLIDVTAYQKMYVRYGLDDPTEDSTVTISVDSKNVLRVTNFVPFTNPQKMSLYLRLVNPDNVGESTPVNIRTYLDALQTVLVDEDVTSAYTVIADITSPASHSITTPSIVGNALQALIEFNVVPTVTIPASGVIKIRIPTQFSIGTITAGSCMVTIDNAGTYMNADSCYNVGNTITLVLPNTVSFPLNLNRKFKLVNVITTPVMMDKFLFDIETYLNDGTTLIETWTDYLQVTPSTFSSPLIDTLERYQTRNTVITGSFITMFNIPAGITQKKATDLKGFLEFTFSGTANDLGMGITTKTKIPCYANAGLTPITGTINCYLTPGSVPTIRVENFQQILAGTGVSISFPKILNPSNAYTVTMKSVQLVNRIRTDINSVSTTMAYAGATATAPTDAVTTSTLGYTFTSTEVCQPTSITFNPTISTTITGPGTFLITLPMYDIGWIPASDSIICKLGATVFPCVRYQGADWITIRLGSGTTYTAGSSITIQNLQVPRYTTSLSGLIVRYISDSAKQQTVYKVLNNFPTPTVPTFTQATLISNKKNKGAVDVEYTIVFVAPNEIPEGASIVILFPSAYNLLSSSPAVAFSSPDLVPSASATKVSFIPSIQKLIVSGFQSLPALTSFSIVVSGLKNPSSLSISQTWQAQVVYNNNYMVFHDDFDKFVFMPALTPGSITFNSISSFPLNADEEGLYIIDFVPASEIPIGGIVQITFPTSNYNDLPSPSYVSVSGGISTFSSCTLSGTTYTLVLDTKYSGGGIIVQIQNVRNPDRGTTDGFIVRTYYDGVMLDDTDSTTLTGRTLTLTNGGDRIIVNSMALDPKNEGEQSTYTFSFVTTNTIENTMQIKIIFPSEYDKTLGENIKCASTSGLIGDVLCSVADRTVTVSGFDAYLPDTTRPVIIQVFGVVNPNYNNGAGTSQFKIGTLVSGDQSFVDYNSLSGVLDILPAPGWAVLYNVLAENLYTRLESDYSFNFTGFANIPRTSSQGAILVDFPSEFDIPDGDINCDILTSSFSPVITCSFSRNRITINGQTEDYTGNVGFIVRNIQNPIDQGTSKNIVLKTYDGLNVRIIERSFKNLDPFMFTYTYPGPLITINNDEPINTIRGTQTQDLYVTVDFPCALNLTLKPYTPGFSVIPFGIDMSLGQTKAKFRVSVPESFAEGTYEIEWETLGDMVPAYYTPIKKTTVIVTKQTGLKITVPTLNYIPFGGNSLPSTFRVDNGPDIQIQLTINFLITYPGISLSTRTLTFEAGQEEASFIIYSSSDDKVTGGTKVEKGTIVISLVGINSGIYALSATSVDFKITDTDLSLPEVSNLAVNAITQHSATVSLAPNEVIMIYYMLALNGTVKPPLSEIKSMGPAPYASTRSRYGIFQVNSSLSAEFTLDNLVAETPYVIYLYYIDGGDNIDSDNRTFVTLNRYNGVDFSLRFKQYAINEAEKVLIINAVSFTLSLFADKLQERKYVATSDNGRLLATEIVKVNKTSRALQEEVFVLLNLQLAASPEYSWYPSPKNLATSLNDKTDELTARLPDADPDYTIEAFEFVRYQPSFPSVPVFKSVDSTWVTFSGKLDNYGWIYVACVKLAEDHGVPTPYQILNYLDNRNIQIAGSRVEVSSPYTNFIVNTTGLTPLTHYTAYIVGGSAHPGYPDPMDQNDIVAIPFITAPSPIIARLNITGGPILTVAYQLLALIMMAYWLLL